MIFKKLKNIKLNEDFDFSSVEVESTAATSYNQTPEMVRTITNLPVMLQSVLYGKFNTKVPRGFKYMDEWEGVGRVLCAKNPFVYDNSGLSNRDIAMLKDAGFTLYNFYINIMRGDNIQREKDKLPDVILSIFRDKLGYTGDFSDIRYINIEYLISEDGGIIVINKLSVYFNDTAAIKNKSLLFGYDNSILPQCFYILRRLICYTGDVIYKVKMPDSKTVKSITKSVNNNNKIRGAIGRIVKADGVSIYDDALAGYILQDSGKSAVIPYYPKWGGLISVQSARKHNSNGIMGVFLRGYYLDSKIKVVKEVIDLSDLDNPEIICGYTT